MVDWQEVQQSRLQARKSSYEAWKCVSLGCSLLVIVMLASKCHQVSTDLKLLLGISRILKSSEAANSSITWPPIPIELLLPAQNETYLASMESVASNESMLMSHLHLSLGREMTGDQLLAQEVDSFLVEFRSAKSTLCLSSALVAIYILSWILMNLAINDTKISNDTSLRNILLICVFGAIDVAASFGFVMVRLVMYSVKNNSFVDDMMSVNGLKDTSVRLSADQLTAFTALRLIAMRSCSAHVDIYVSFVIVLLTALRLYAAVRALSYYRLLKKFANHSYSASNSYNSSIPPKQSTFCTSFNPISNTLVNGVQAPMQDDLRLCPNVDLINEMPQSMFRQQQRSASLEGALRYQRRQQDTTRGVSRRRSMTQTLPREATESSGSTRASQVILLPQEKALPRLSQTMHRTAAKRRHGLPIEVPDFLMVNEKSAYSNRARTNGDELVCEQLSGPGSDDDPLATGVKTRKPSKLSYTLLDPSQWMEAKRTGRLFVATSEPDRAKGSLLTTSGKYRLVAKYKRSSSKEEAKCSQSGSVSTISSGAGDDSDNSVAKLHKNSTSTWQATGSSGMRQTEELVGQKMHEAISKASGSLLKKYYYT